MKTLMMGRGRVKPRGAEPRREMGALLGLLHVEPVPRALQARKMRVGKGLRDWTRGPEAWEGVMARMRHRLLR